ncbi:MAG TPA: hypothetical protein VGK58_23195 [Lacipirellulaceae bacterium]
MRRIFYLALIQLLLLNSTVFAQSAAQTNSETLAEISARLATETAAAYDACPFSVLSKDYFSRFSLDPDAVAENGEVAIDSSWRIVLPSGIDPIGRRMAEHLQTFLRERMKLTVDMSSETPESIARLQQPALVLLDSGGGDSNTLESFTIRVQKDRITVQGDSPNGLRDAIVRLLDRIGFREAPILTLGTIVYRPRLPVRLGAVPQGGSYKDVVFFGFNAVLYGGGDLYALSQSDAIPELSARRVRGLLESHREGMKQLSQYGLKAYAFLNTRQKFPKSDPIFQAHPEIRGALTWSADGEYTLCTLHPLVRQYLRESLQGLFKSLPELQGVVIIIGGEGFYHCHMRPYGVEKGHTNCSRCEPLGAEAAVADLCNDLASAIREVNPQAELVAWPYSAEHVWAKDRAVSGFIEKLKPGVTLFTEIEKSETIQKPHGIVKDIWDYSIDLIGPGPRAQEQIGACAKNNVRVYLKSEPELGFEAPRLPQIPCMDRWADRAEALASCGADGAWVFPAFRPFYGTSTAEINKFLWWSPVPDREELLHAFAQRLAGKQSGDALRQAWKHVSDTIPFSPELPPYYTGPYYLGPMHPMCANKNAALPVVFYGRFLFRAEIMDSEGLKKEPTFLIAPRGDAKILGESYREMERHLQQAATKIREASPNVDDRHHLTFDAEAVPVLWFYHTARTHANFYESCQLRDAVAALTAKPAHWPEEIENARALIARWKRVLEDERQNTTDALPLIRRDMRLDPYYGGDHTFSHGEEMMGAKFELLEEELSSYLPSLEARVTR